MALAVRPKRYYFLDISMYLYFSSILGENSYFPKESLKCYWADYYQDNFEIWESGPPT